MRKILLSLFIVNILLSFFVFYDLEKNSINNNIVISGEEQAATILIDKAINNLDRKEVVDTLIETTEKYEADLILNVYNNAPGEKFNLIKYIHLKDNGKIFKKLKITGDILDNYDKSNNYLDSRDINKMECIGRIGVLENDFKIRISTFENLKDEKYVLSGYYSLNIANEKSDAFIKELSSELHVDVSRVSGMNRGKIMIPPILKIIPMIIVFLLTILVVVYDLISRYKDIGVKKLNGYSDKKLKYEYYRNIGVLYIISSVVSYSILGLLFMKFNNMLFLELIFRSIINTSILFIVICLILLLPLSFMHKITIASAIKNMKPVQIIRRFSNGFKIIFTIILIGLFIYSLKIYMPVYNFYFENLKKWEDTINYAQVSLSYDERTDDFEDMIFNMVQNKKLYVHANEKGGIQIQVNDKFDGEKHGETQSYFESIMWKSIEINNNYLKKNPIYDINNNKISVDDNENINYILIPEKYADLKKEIIYNLENNYYSLHDVPIQFAEGRKKEQKAAYEMAPEFFAKEFGTIKAIIIKNGQEHFTYDLFKYPETNNMVKDRVVIVHNDKAGLLFDISNNGGYFIKVNNPDQPFLAISDKVNELGLSAYYYQAFSVYGSIAGQVTIYLETLSQIAVIFGIVGITIAVLIAYSIMIYMEKEKMDLSIKLLNGYSFIGRHGKKLLGTILFYITFIPAFYFVRGSILETKALALLLVAIVILDLFATYIFIRIYEKRNIKDILKGN